MMEDVLTMGGSATLGFVFRQMAESRKQNHDLLMAAHSVKESSMESASSRGGTWMRRGFYFLIAAGFVSVLFATYFGKPVILEYELHRKLLFFEWDKVKHVVVNGVVFLAENRKAFLAMISFYFGQGIKG